jgi:hypothetical protein
MWWVNIDSAAALEGTMHVNNVSRNSGVAADGCLRRLV